MCPFQTRGQKANENVDTEKHANKVLLRGAVIIYISVVFKYIHNKPLFVMEIVHFQIYFSKLNCYSQRLRATLVFSLFVQL